MDVDDLCVCGHPHTDICSECEDILKLTKQLCDMAEWASRKYRDGSESLEEDRSVYNWPLFIGAKEKRAKRLNDLNHTLNFYMQRYDHYYGKAKYSYYHLFYR